MLSKEEIEKAKEWLNWMKKQELFLPYISNILKYIDQLEQENNKQNKIIDEMTKVIIASGICDYFIKDNCKHYAGENKKLCDECIKQYFEKKVEEK